MARAEAERAPATVPLGSPLALIVVTFGLAVGFVLYAGEPAAPGPTP